MLTSDLTKVDADLPALVAELADALAAGARYRRRVRTQALRTGTDLVHRMLSRLRVD